MPPTMSPARRSRVSVNCSRICDCPLQSLLLRHLRIEDEYEKRLTNTSARREICHDRLRQTLQQIIAAAAVQC